MAIIRDVRVRARISILMDEIKDENDPAGRGGKQGASQKKMIVDVPEVVLDYDELLARISAIGDVILHGYELDNDLPPAAITEEATGITTTAAVLHARVTPSGATTCGFMVDLTKEMTAASHAADESPLNGTTQTEVHHHLAGLIPNTRYYFRAWALVAGITKRYGRVRSFKTFPTP